jgi:hypothetical protein
VVLSCSVDNGRGEVRGQVIEERGFARALKVRRNIREGKEIHGEVHRLDCADDVSQDVVDPGLGSEVVLSCSVDNGITFNGKRGRRHDPAKEHNL